MPPKVDSGLERQFQLLLDENTRLKKQDITNKELIQQLQLIAEEKKKLEEQVLKSKKIQEQLALYERFLRISKGQRDPHTAARLLSNPENWDTMTELNSNEVKFETNVDWIANHYPDMQDLQEYGQYIKRYNIALNRKCRAEVVDLTKSLELAKTMSTQMQLQPQQESMIKRLFKRNKKVGEEA